MGSGLQGKTAQMRPQDTHHAGWLLCERLMVSETSQQAMRGTAENLRGPTTGVDGNLALGAATAARNGTKRVFRMHNGLFRGGALQQPGVYCRRQKIRIAIM